MLKARRGQGVGARLDHGEGTCGRVDELEKIEGESATTGWRFTMPELPDELVGIDSDPDWSALQLT